MRAIEGRRLTDGAARIGCRWESPQHQETHNHSKLRGWQRNNLYQGKRTVGNIGLHHPAGSANDWGGG
jgi:hypothetical protein